MCLFWILAPFFKNLLARWSLNETWIYETKYWFDCYCIKVIFSPNFKLRDSSVQKSLVMLNRRKWPSCRLNRRLYKAECFILVQQDAGGGDSGGPWLGGSGEDVPTAGVPGWPRSWRLRESAGLPEGELEPAAALQRASAAIRAGSAATHHPPQWVPTLAL